MTALEVIAIGVDVVDLQRWDRAVKSDATGSEGLLTAPEAVLTPAEQAACFALKEAVLKCLDADILLHGFQSIDCAGFVQSNGHDDPIKLRGRLADRAAARGVQQWAAWRRHDDDTVVAVAVAVGRSDGDHTDSPQ
jgi:phosphopantetheinyl transferase (holo-ACP synthase)